MSTVTDVQTLHNFIGGEFTQAAVDSTLEDRDPATAELTATCRSRARATSSRPCAPRARPSRLGAGLRYRSAPAP